MRILVVALAGAVVAAQPACVADVGEVEEGQAVTGGEEEPEAGQEYSTFTTRSLYAGDRVAICHAPAGARLRSGPGKAYLVLRLLQNGKRATVRRRSGGWYRLQLSGGALGWTWRGFLCLVDPGNNNPANFALGRQGVINIAHVFRGYSYWWGGAAFPKPWDSPRSKPRGRCYSATYGGHQGRYGADCSGYVGKVWRLPSALPFGANLHPFSTYHFYHGRNHWTHIARGATRRADALVHHSGGAGHIMLFERGDPWGNAWTYEAKGCAYGVVHNLRPVSSSYRARRRKGI